MFIDTIFNKYCVLSFVKKDNTTVASCWLSPDGSRFSFSDDAAIAAKELLDAYYPHWQETSQTDIVNVFDALLNKHWVCIKYDKSNNSYFIYTKVIIKALLFFLTQLDKSCFCTINCSSVIQTGIVEDFLSRYKVDAQIIKPKKFNKTLYKKSKTSKGKKPIQPMAIKAEDVSFTNLTETKKLASFIKDELKLTDPFNFDNSTWLRFTRRVAPKLLVALLLDMDIVPRQQKGEFARYLTSRLRALTK